MEWFLSLFVPFVLFRGHKRGSSGGEFQEWYHVPFEFAGGQLEHFFKLDGLRDIKLARVNAAKRCQMSATTKLLAEFMRDTAHVRPFGTGQTKHANGLFVLAELKAVNVNQPRLALDFDALPRKLIKRHTCFFHRRDHRWDLHLV